jgi:hypothetical protein
MHTTHRVSGESMSPRFKPNEYVFTQLILYKDIILWGEPYVIQTLEYTMIRYLHQCPLGNYILKAENQTFQDIHLEKGRVIDIYLVKGLVGH